MTEIPGFDLYFYSNGQVFWKKSGKEVRPIVVRGITYTKLKCSDGIFRKISDEKLQSLLGYDLKLPSNTIRVPFTKDYYITEKGVVYSFGHRNPCGKVLKQRLDRNGYPIVRIKIEGMGRKNFNVHWLMLHSFVKPYYSKEGLCCLHLDNDKTNNNLSNLKLGTYQENNKAAYRDGLNPGNGLKKQK